MYGVCPVGLGVQDVYWELPAIALEHPRNGASYLLDWH